MRALMFAIFLSVALALYGLINYYIFIRGWQALPPGSAFRTWYLNLFLVVALSYIAGRLLERVWISPLSDILVWLGSFWLGAMLYFFLIVVVVDIARVVNHFLPWYPGWITASRATAQMTIAAASVILVAVILITGHINARYPRIRHLDLTVAKAHGAAPPLTIAVASDIHLGTLIGKARLRSIVSNVNALKPDLVVLAGDIVDEDLGPVIRENLGETLKQIKAPLGVYAITGNHEYIGGVEKACSYLEDHGITMIRDSVVHVADRVYLVGREDRSIHGFAGKTRKPLEELMAHVNTQLPVILLDHQPFDLEEADRYGADIQISGHTHHGQLWPLNYITKMIYEVSTGLKQVGNTQVYVSTGVGTWGPPVRLGNRPEIIHLRLSTR